MKLSYVAVCALSLLSINAIANPDGTGLNKHFDPAVVAIIYRAPPLPPLYICATLPPGFQHTNGSQLKGATTALNAQGDEGLEETRHRFYSADPNCISYLGEPVDQTPLPFE